MSDPLAAIRAACAEPSAEDLEREWRDVVSFRLECWCAGRAPPPKASDLAINIGRRYQDMLAKGGN